MAEYYPLLAKAVGSLPNSTPESRRVVYERARKALIGQLRTLHPPVPDDDIERESVSLDLAIERLEAELANGGIPSASPIVPSDAKASPPGGAEPSKPAPAPPASGASTPPAVKPPVIQPPAAKPPAPSSAVKPGDAPLLRDGGALGPAETRPPVPLRTKAPNKPPLAKPVSKPPLQAPPVPLSPSVEVTPVPATLPVPSTNGSPVVSETGVGDTDVQPPANEPKRLKPPRSDPQRPIAPQPPAAKGPKRRLWIIPVAIALVAGAVGFAAFKLRDHPETIARGKPTDQVQSDSGKIAERVGGPQSSTSTSDTNGPQDQAPQSSDAPAQAPNAQPQQGAPTAANPELPVAHRAALLVEAPDEPNKVKTFLGTVVWKLNNVPQGPNDAVGLAVEADIDLPDDKMKAVVTFAKNTEASLPASHTINVHFTVEPGSFTGDVKQISVPQMRPESSPSGEPLAGVTVQIVPNSFLVGLSPGNAETANTDLIRRLQWLDIPMLLDSGKIAKLTFEKSDSGQRDLTEALDSWAKQ